MNKILLFLSVFLLNYIVFSQSLPTDYLARYDFVNGSLSNLAQPGTGDLTGNIISGSLHRMDRFGRSANAIRVNGNTLNGYAYTSSNNRNEISVSLWVQGRSPSGGSQRVFRLKNSSNDDGVMVDIRPNNQLFVFFKNSGSQVSGTVTLPSFFNGFWHHLVITIKKGSRGYVNKVYIDGVLNTSLSNDISLTGNTDNFLNAGARFVVSPVTGVGAYYNNIDDIKLYERDLSAQEVAAIYSHTPTPQVIYVNHEARGNNDGTSWENAYINLQDALAVSNISSQIWVAKGTYKPDTIDRDASFVLNCNFYGGFIGDETQLSDRDLTSIHTTNKTILSGDLIGNDSSTPSFNDSTRSDNSKHVVEVTVNGIKIDGFTIQDGYADATTGDDRFGGGVFKNISVGELTVKNCIIKNNTAFLGAGLSLTTRVQNSIMNIDSCIIENNLANVGSGIDYHFSGTNANMNIAVTNTLFKNNKTDDDPSKSRLGTGASAMRLRAHFSNVELNAKIVNNTFVNNINNGSGTSEFPVLGMHTNQGSFGIVHVANNIFYGNTNNTLVAKAIGNSSNTGSRLTTNNSSRFIANNIDEDGISSIAGTIATSTVNPNLDANFKPTTGSSAIDSGDNSYIPANITIDLEGNTRIYNVNVDRGAYEYREATSIQRILTINSNNGSVVTNPNPTNGRYDDGTSVTLTAIPDAGYQFEEFRVVNTGGGFGTVSSSNPISVTMDADKTVTAIFSKIQRALTITVIGNGTVTTSPNAPNRTYDDGTQVTLVPTAASGYEFVDWSGDESGVTNPLIITMNADKNITVNFSATADINDISKFDFAVYPNPTTGILNINIESSILKAEVYDLLGRKIKETSSKSLLISDLPNGVYLLKIITENRKIGLKKIIKK